MEIERAVANSMYLRRVGNGNKCWRYRGGNYKCDLYKTGGDGRGDYERKRQKTQKERKMVHLQIIIMIIIQVWRKAKEIDLNRNNVILCLELHLTEPDRRAQELENLQTYSAGPWNSKHRRTAFWDQQATLTRRSRIFVRISFISSYYSSKQYILLWKRPGPF